MPQQPHIQLIVLLGTGQDLDNQEAKATIPFLIYKSFPHPIRMFPGPGKVKIMENISWVGKRINGLYSVVDTALGLSVPKNIIYAWRESYKQDETDEFIYMGSSRGGFSAQILAQIIDRYGYHRGENSERLERQILRGFLGDANADIAEENKQIKALYALDPVGTYKGVRTPSKFLGFISTQFSRAVRRGRVILMFGERRFPFRPNIFRDVENCPELKQVWFNGIHADAWGPSMHALPVLAYLLYDLEEIGVKMDMKMLRKHLRSWTGVQLSVPDQHLAWTRFRSRCQAPVHGQSQFRHQSLAGNEGHKDPDVCFRTQREKAIFNKLKEVVLKPE